MDVQHWCFDIETSENIFNNYCGYKSIITSQLSSSNWFMIRKNIHIAPFENVKIASLPPEWFDNDNLFIYFIKFLNKSHKKRFVAIANNFRENNAVYNKCSIKIIITK